MSNKSYIRGFCKVAALIFNDANGRKRPMTEIEENIARDIPIPEEEMGVSLKDVAKARVERENNIKNKAKSMQLREVSPNFRELSEFKNYLDSHNGDLPPDYLTGLRDSLPADWKEYMPKTPRSPTKAMWADGEVHTMPDVLKRFKDTGKIGGGGIDPSMFRALYNGHTNLLERIAKGDYPPVSNPIKK